MSDLNPFFGRLARNFATWNEAAKDKEPNKQNISIVEFLSSIIEPAENNPITDTTVASIWGTDFHDPIFVAGGTISKTDAHTI